MPQLVLEYSANIIEKNNLVSLLKDLNQLLSTTLVTPLNSCKSRALAYTTYCVGDGEEKHAFVHINVKIMPGRDNEKIKVLGKAMLSILQKYFFNSSQNFKLQITIDIIEIGDNYFKFVSYQD